METASIWFFQELSTRENGECLIRVPGFLLVMKMFETR